jgi:hypothetical protein
MPGRDGTGPQGTGPRGRRMGPCRNIAPAAAGIDEEKKTEDTGSAGTGEAAGQTTTPVVYGVGRGGRPRGCGMGRCGGWRR